MGLNAMIYQGLEKGITGNVMTFLGRDRIWQSGRKGYVNEWIYFVRTCSGLLTGIGKDKGKTGDKRTVVFFKMQVAAPLFSMPVLDCALLRNAGYEDLKKL